MESDQSFPQRLAGFFSPRRHDGLPLVMLVAGVAGFLLGAMVFSDWQVAVETAQVVAGIVQYPPENAFYMYHTKLWTLLHQVLAVFLMAGMSETSASIMVSGLLGMVTFQAFAVVILALSRDWLLALGGTIAIFFSRPTEFGVVYPIWYMGASHTYGILGLSYILLVAGLLGGGWKRPGLILLGMAPAVHPSLGVWLGLMAGIAALLDARQFREKWLRWWKYFAIGCGVTILSLAIQLVFIVDVPKVDTAGADKYFLPFVKMWDAHRQPVWLDHAGVKFNWAMLLLAAAWMTFLRRDVPESSRFMLRMILVGGLMGWAAIKISHIPVENQPRPLLILMPARLLNFSILASLPVLIGLIGCYRKKIWGASVLVLLLAGLLFGGAMVNGMVLFFSSQLWHLLALGGANLEAYEKYMVHPWTWMPLMGAVLFACATVAFLQRKFGGGKEPNAKSTRGKSNAETPSKLDRVTVGLRYAAYGLFIIYALLTVVLSVRLGKANDEKFKDRTNNEVLAKVAAGEGLLLTGGDLHLVQLKTRRPVLIDGGGLDGLAYTLESAALMDQILRDVYQIDMFNPPQDAYGAGAVPSMSNQIAWEQLPPSHWSFIREKYKVTEVLTYAGWRLKLPRVASDDMHILYRIPE